MDSPRERNEESGGTAIERTAAGPRCRLSWQQELAANAAPAYTRNAEDSHPAPDAQPDHAGTAALAHLARELDPAALLDFSEDLHRFAAACGHEAIARLEDQAQQEIPAHLEEIKTLSDGMEISVMTGQLRERATIQVVAQQVAQARDCTLRGAAHDVERARVLRQDTPAVLQALADGRVGAAHARTLIDLARKIEPDRPDTPRTGDLEDIETYDQQVIDAELDCRQHRQDLCASLLEKTPGRTPSAVKRTGTRLLNRLLDTSATDRHTIEHAKRTVRITAGENGMCNLHAYLPALAGEAIGNLLSELATLHTDPAIDQAVNTLHPEDQPGPATERDHASSTRTRAQARADALVELLLAGPDGSGLENVAPAVTISIPATVFPGLTGLNPAPGHRATPGHGAGNGSGRAPGPRTGAGAEEPGTASTDRLDGLRLPAGAVAPETETLGAFDPADLAALLPNATTWTRIITDPWTGAMTAYDTQQYRPTAAMRRALALRDRTCRVPGCGRRASDCEPDHVVEWQDGGTTSLDNLVSLCKRCHRLKSWGLLHLKLSPGGTLHATTWWDRQRAGTADAPWDTPAEPVGDPSPWISRHGQSPAETELLRGLARHLEWVNRRATGHSITSLSPTKKARHKQRVHTIRTLRRDRGASPAATGPGGPTRLIAADQHATGTRRTMHHLGYTPEDHHDFQHNTAATAQHLAQPGRNDADGEQQCA